MSLRSAYRQWAAIVIAFATSACTSNQVALPPPAPPNIYVADSGSNTVLVFPISANGNATPSRTFTSSVLTSVNFLAVDSAGNEWADNFFSNSGVFEFAASASGMVSPIATISGSNTGITSSTGLWVDAGGRVYVANANTNSVLIFNAGHTGNVVPDATIAGANTLLSHPIGIFVDVTGNVWVTCNSPDRVLEFAAGQTGNATPVVDIEGSNTGMIDAIDVALDSMGRIYVVDDDASVRIFAAGSNGNATPTTLIAAGFTIFASDYVAIDRFGAIYTTNRTTDNAVIVFPAGSSGTVTPSAIIHGTSTGLTAGSGPGGLAVH